MRGAEDEVHRVVTKLVRERARNAAARRLAECRHLRVVRRGAGVVVERCGALAVGPEAEDEARGQEAGDSASAEGMSRTT